MSIFFNTIILTDANKDIQSEQAVRTSSLQLVWPRTKFRKLVSHEGNTEEENNGYVIFRANIHESARK
jgi:hypothetical protein